MSRLVLVLSLIFFIFHSLSEFAQASTAVITMLKGESEIFVNPSTEPTGGGPHVKFNNVYYKIKKAKIGRRVKYKQVVKTGVNAQIKLTYPNGDTFMVGPATAYSLERKKSKNKKRDLKTLILLYGKVRAVVSKEGPLKKMEVKTKASVAGVRGTDFFVSYTPHKEKTLLSVLRGKVEIKPKNSKAPPTVVSKGVTAQIQASEQDRQKGLSNGNRGKIVEEVQLKPVTKNILAEIQTSSHIKLTKKAEVEVQNELAQLDKNVIKEIKDLNKKSVKVVLEDIKVEDKVQYEKLTANQKNGEIENIEMINSQVVGQLYKKAPVEKSSKLSESDMDSAEDFYKKYKMDLDDE